MKETSFGQRSGKEPTNFYTISLLQPQQPLINTQCYLKHKEKTLYIHLY